MRITLQRLEPEKWLSGCGNSVNQCCLCTGQYSYCKLFLYKFVNFSFYKLASTRPPIKVGMNLYRNYNFMHHVCITEFLEYRTWELKHIKVFCRIYNLTKFSILIQKVFFIHQKYYCLCMEVYIHIFPKVNPAPFL